MGRKKVGYANGLKGFIEMIKFKLPKLSLDMFGRERVLGVSKSRQKYDLPLAASTTNSFLRLLIALMSVLGLLALSASFALSAMTHRWSDGLTGKISVEIPATDSGGDVIAPDLVRTMTDDVAKILSTHPDIKEVRITEEKKVQELLSPWLGKDMVMDSLPIPGLISVTMDEDAKTDMKALETSLREVAPRARIDTHESWLTDVVRFTGALQFAATLLLVVIGATTLVAVAGGVRSKLSENKEELELLHLMGASDSYIAKQIQKHTMILSLQGGTMGVVAGLLVLLCVSMIAGHMSVNLIPEFKLGALQKIILVGLPIPIALLAMMTARFTVFRVLTKMP